MSLSTKTEDALIDVLKGLGASVIKLLDAKTDQQLTETRVLRHRENGDALDAAAQRTGASK